MHVIVSKDIYIHSCVAQSRRANMHCTVMACSLIPKSHRDHTHGSCKTGIIAPYKTHTVRDRDRDRESTLLYYTSVCMEYIYISTYKLLAERLVMCVKACVLSTQSSPLGT